MSERRNILVEATGDPELGDALMPLALAHKDNIPISLSEPERVRAWAAGMVVVKDLIKTPDQAGLSEQLWRFCADPDEYPLELRTVLGGSDHEHSAEILDWVAPSMAIASAMEAHGIGPAVSVLSADEAAIRLNGLHGEETRRHTDDTLKLVRQFAQVHYPGVEVQTDRLDWESLTAEPYSADQALLASHDARLGEPSIKVVRGLEAMVSNKGGEPASVATYLALHNPSYGVYGEAPVVKIAGTPEVRFNVVQEALASLNQELLAVTDLAGDSRYVTGTIRGTSSTAPYYVRSGPTLRSAMDALSLVETPGDLSRVSPRLGRVTSLALEHAMRETAGQTA